MSKHQLSESIKNLRTHFEEQEGVEIAPDIMVTFIGVTTQLEWMEQDALKLELSQDNQ